MRADVDADIADQDLQQGEAPILIDDGSPEFFARVNSNLHALNAYLTANPAAWRGDGEFMLDATPERSWSLALHFPIPLVLGPFIEGIIAHEGEVLTQHIGNRLKIKHANTVRKALDGDGVIKYLDMAIEVPCTFCMLCSTDKHKALPLPLSSAFYILLIFGRFFMRDRSLHNTTFLKASTATLTNAVASYI